MEFLKVENLCKVYGKGESRVTALDHVSLTPPFLQILKMRFKGDELAQYNLWLDYLDALDAVKTTSAPDIKWPTPPGEQAS